MKISKILSYVVLAVGVISGVLLYMMNTGISDLLTEKEATDPRELLVPETAEAIYGAVSPLYSLSLVIIAVLLIATLVTVISGLIKNPASLKKVGLGIVAFLVVVGIAYGISEGKEVITRDGDVITAGTTKWVEAGIISFYIFSVVAIVSMIAAGVKKSISN